MRIEKQNTAALFVDIQEKLLPAIHEGQHLLARTVTLLEGLKILQIPMLFLRQYPKGLGDTVPELIHAAGGLHTPFDKLAYSAMKDDAIAAKIYAMKAQGITNVLVCGVESHICVLQSCIDLSSAGITPVMIVDCVGSRNPWEKDLAQKRAMQEGVLLSSVESILFELCVTAGTDEFKAIAKLVK